MPPEGRTMSELTLESLAKRVEALERALGTAAPAPRPKDWRRVIGMFHDSDFMRAVDEECLRLRVLEREEARRKEPPAGQQENSSCASP